MHTGLVDKFDESENKKNGFHFEITKKLFCLK